MKQKGQINQVFIYIIALLVIAAIALLGVNSIGNILKDKCVADKIIFEDDLSSAITSNNDYGSVNTVSLKSPCKFHALCLVDATQIGAGNTALSDFSDTAFQGATIIKQSVIEGVKTNIFIIGSQGEIEPLSFVPQLQLANPHNVTCMEMKGGGYHLLLEGQGRKTLVSEK